MAFPRQARRIRSCAPLVTAVRVVDASALAALLFGEPEADAVAARLEGAQLVAPALLAFELANVCLVKCRRHAEAQSTLLSALGLFRQMGVEAASVDQESVVRLALETGLTAYDASYLWLARRLGAEIVTLDKQLAAAQR